MLEISPTGVRLPSRPSIFGKGTISDAAETAINVRQRLRVGLADFPDQQQRDEFALFAQFSDALGDAAAPLVELHAGPGHGFGLGELDGSAGSLEVQHGNLAKAAPVDGGFVMAAETRFAPFAFFEKVEYAAIGGEGFRHLSLDFMDEGFPLRRRRDSWHLQAS